ncbi:WD repeat protein [Spathaspora passalidarum NRRL Y-27907]|uniref:WD repeat protein n=1 Tax=Spathaspora passalidarum (strain NRRL Y-27907 / 11-Y1) TaxID=619300 RepID=G3AUD9_SPAPN|nr:WD repeat protein [Spathaspora passalidarum NRRL Y-27907]EGW30515.1 WD repeat protein [Spathaspora passalidarum NRRL Y-27907]
MSGFNQISSLNEVEFAPLHHYGPVTALKIYKNYVLAGYGPILKIYQMTQGDLLDVAEVFCKQVFSRNKIHHIEITSQGRLCLSGARSFMVLDLEEVLQGKGNFKERAINEWIVTCAFYENWLLILNSHNVVYKVDLASFEFDKVHCQEKSILYSGSIQVLDNGTVYVAAGTVMSGVIIWDLHSRKIVHNLTDHEGSIFGVKVDKTGKYIVSCSDDRSIKLYDFASGTVLATGWGHGSRIWTLEFFKGDNVKIMSTGEDCSLRLWQYQEGNSQLVQLEMVENCHSGKHIWSGDVDDLEYQVCVTGGADGRIKLHDLNKVNRTEYSLQEISSQTGLVFGKKDFIRDYFELKDRLIVLISNGDLVEYSDNSFKTIAFNDQHKLKDFAIVKGFSDINIVIIAARNGDLLIADFTSDLPQLSWIQDEYLGSNKLTNLLVYSTDNKYYVLVDVPNPNIPFILREFDSSFNLVNVTQLSQPNQTSFTTTDMVVDSVNNWLVIASRYVTIAAYDLSTTSMALFKKLSPGDTITSVQIITSKTNELALLILVKDGSYLYTTLTLSTTFHLDVTHANKLTKGFIEGGYIKSNKLVLYGFKSSYFYIWNETCQFEIMNELCGGSHRQWKLAPSKFIYVKDKTTLVIRNIAHRFVNDGLIHLGTHGREIRDVAVSPDGKLLVSASEDATIAVSQLEDGVKGIWSMNNHISGLQRVKFLNSEYMASSAANEEFIIWKVTQSNIPLVKEFVRLKPSAVENPDLRIMNFASIELESNVFILVTVYSNSNIKIWRIDLNKEHYGDMVKLLVNDFYTTCCILNVELLQKDDKTWLMIGATDGYVTIWDVTSKLDPEEHKLGASIIHQQLHQNGVKAMEVFTHQDGYRLITGGDDNALVVCDLQVPDLKLDIVGYEESAASATITSISVVGEHKFVTTSVDQIVRIWEYNEGLTCLSARYTTIADTGCSASMGSTIYIGGAGLSSWKVNNL